MCVYNHLKTQIFTFRNCYFIMGKRPRSQTRGQNIDGNNCLRKSFLRIVGICGAIIFLTTIMVYTPALRNGFVNWDDNEYVYENSYIRVLNLHTLSWMLTTFYAGNWHPLTWFSHATDYAIWGLNPFGHHLTNIILHGLNTLLVFLLVTQLMLIAKKIPSASLPSLMFLTFTVRSMIVASVTALLFGVHPLHVESVAWVAERKDLLCAFFFLLTLFSYIFFASTADKKTCQAWFTACMVLATAALMAKPMAVTLPLVMLLLDIYPLKRITISEGTSQNLRVLLEKVPLFLLISILSIFTILAQHAGGAFESFERMPLHFRLVNALYSPLFYLAKMLWPIGLVPFYPFSQAIGFFDPTYGISGILALSITGGCVWLWKRGRILFLIVWAYYLITLLPVVGIVQVGIQAAADRYTYLPSVSIFLVAGIAVAQLFAVLVRSKNIIITGGVIVVLIFILFGLLTVKQIKIWQDSETFWKHIIKSFPGRMYFAHNNLGVLYSKRGLYDKALEEYEKALAINPTYATAHNNLGVLYSMRGLYDKALEEYEKALASNPNFAEAHTNRGNAYFRKGEYDKALEEYEKALASNPSLAGAYLYLGNTYYKKGMYDEAIAQYKKALAINSNYVEVHNSLGMAYYKISNYSMAADHLDKALALGYKVDPKLLESIKPDQ